MPKYRHRFFRDNSAANSPVYFKNTPQCSNAGSGMLLCLALIYLFAKLQQQQIKAKAKQTQLTGEQ